MKSYIVTICETKQIVPFKSVNKAKSFIQKWAEENNQHTGKIDIDSKTILWQVGTFNNPVIQFERLTN